MQFVSDMATPDAAVVAAINATEEPPSAEAPNPKKPKIELPVVVCWPPIRFVKLSLAQEKGSLPIS